MKYRVLFCSALLVALGFVSGSVFPQDAKGDAAEDKQAEMQAWIKLHQPGEHHARLGEFVGDWNVTGKFWGEPGQEPVLSRGSATISWILDKRFTKQEYESEYMGAPFQGIGIDGYDNQTQKYVSIWMDSMSTSVFRMEGTTSEDGTCTMFGEWPEGTSGELKPVKSVSQVVDGKVQHTMFSRVGDDWHRMMELVYTRKE